MERMRRGFGGEEHEGLSLDRPEVGRGGRIRSLRWTLASIGLVSLLGFGGGYLVTVIVFFPAQGASNDLVKVPELVGRSGEDAEVLLEGKGLKYEETTAFHHPEAPAGAVVAQNPLPGQMTRPGAPVRVTLSLGPREQAVPDVRGLSRRQAEIVLERAGFRTDVNFVDAEVDVGRVVDTEPDPGTGLVLPGNVRLQVSAGPPRVEVPDLVTRSLPEAQSLLERLGLRVGSVSREWASQSAAGTVIGQAPESGTVVDRGTRVSVTVAVVPPVEPGDTASEGYGGSADDGETGS